MVPLVVQIATAQRPTPHPKSPSLLRRRFIFAPRLLPRARTRITSNTTPAPPSAALNGPREHGTRRVGSALAVITNISTIQRMPSTALCERGVKSDVESCVHVRSFHFHAYMIAYGHGTLHGPTRPSSAARDRVSFDSARCDTCLRTGPSACGLRFPPPTSQFPLQLYTPLIPPHYSIQQEARLH